MATITIKDLSDNVELDRKAMQDISGGARYRAQPGVRGAALPARGTRIVDFRTGAVRTGVQHAGKQPK
ncbi:MAG: hypothetical protein ACXWC4_03475 [Telluria sp.]